MVAGHFSEINDTETYGKAGYHSKADFNFTAEFAGKGNTIWLNSEANVWTPAWPNKDGECRYLMAATVRDFSKGHPDFDFGSLTGASVQKGMVEPSIGTDRKPIRSSKAPLPPVTFDRFAGWWRTDSTNADETLRSYESCVDIPMSKASDGLWEYDSYRDSPDHGFWPVEGPANRFGETSPTCYVKPPPDSSIWVMGGLMRNGNFCMESHASFIYRPGQNFTFYGDDDLWVFINDKLVVDLGGVHLPKSDSVDLDSLSLTAGMEYKWDFFYCDRQPCGSALRFKTSIYFEQRNSLYGIKIPGPASGSIGLEIWRRTDGNGSCASLGTASDSIKATILAYQVLNSSGIVVKELGSGGTFYGGAVKIATPVVTVDTAFATAAWDSLTPGATYRVAAFEPANAALKVEIPFKVPAAAIGIRKKAAPTAVRSKKDLSPDALGRRFPSPGPLKFKSP
jgi:fibro-slime domain-containing protein